MRSHRNSCKRDNASVVVISGGLEKIEGLILRHVQFDSQE